MKAFDLNRTQVAAVMATFMFIAIFIGTANAQNDQLTVIGHVVNEESDRGMSLVTLFNYNFRTQESNYVKQTMVESNDRFKFKLDYQKEYMIEIACSNGTNKRVMVTSDVMKGFEEDKYKYEFSVDINDGKGQDNPEAAAYIYFDPSAEGFDYADERPMSASAGN